MTIFTNVSENDPNRDPVLQDQKVFQRYQIDSFAKCFIRPFNLGKSVWNSLWVKHDYVPDCETIRPTSLSRIGLVLQGLTGASQKEVIDKFA